MYYKKECIAMLLAGGQGSRLYGLTKHTAKPAVSFGGKYKIIDFPLSNCINSGIDTVGVLTQYQPLMLNEYIGKGTPWDLDRTRGGLSILPPYQKKNDSDWYKGPANAIYQNIDFIKKYSPDHVLVLAADHIYKMNYRKMIEEHKKTNAACTIATITVPIEEAARFGICATNDQGKIISFEEKPKNPSGNQASMGIYVFKTKELIEYLEEDNEDSFSDNDFGKNIIPKIIKKGDSVYAYRFTGYWKDVGTISSLWEANMDLIGNDPKLIIKDNNFRIYSRNFARAPQFIADNAVIQNSLVSEGCVIKGRVENSVLSGGVLVEEGAIVKDSVIMDDVKVMKNAEVYTAIVDSGVSVATGDKIGKNTGKSQDVIIIEKASKAREIAGEG